MTTRGTSLGFRVKTIHIFPSPFIFRLSASLIELRAAGFISIVFGLSGVVEAGLRNPGAAPSRCS